jgi:hypothetical protein
MPLPKRTCPKCRKNQCTVLAKRCKECQIAEWRVTARRCECGTIIANNGSDKCRACYLDAFADAGDDMTDEELDELIAAQRPTMPQDDGRDRESIYGVRRGVKRVAGIRVLHCPVRRNGHYAKEMVTLQ